MTEFREGGCLCGKVRYRIAWPPLAQATCHCRNCQKQAGSALSVIAVVPRSELELNGGLRTFVDRGDSGQPVYRRFCPDCGSPVLTDMPKAGAQGIIFIKAGTLDEVSDLKPATHYWTDSAQGWAPFPPDGKKLGRG